jgi:acetyltransferase-like isoleucine patch superfamily enzyme
MSLYPRIRDFKHEAVSRLSELIAQHAARAHEMSLKKKCIAAEDAHFYPSTAIDNLQARDRIEVGRRAHVRGNLHTFTNGGRIRIGDDCYVGDETRIWSMDSITIGDRVLISHNVNIHDHNAHSLSAGDRHLHYLEIIERGHPANLVNVRAQPVVIEADAWIGFNATVLKGVRIGRGAIVGACSVVTKNVDPFTIVVGNPARYVGPAQE